MLNEGELFQSVIRQAIDDLIELIKKDEWEDRGDVFDWLFKDNDDEMSLSNLLENFPGEITPEIMREKIWERVDEECKHRISPTSLQFFIEKGSDHVVKEAPKTISANKQQSCSDLRMSMIDMIIERTDTGDIEWAREREGDKVIFSSNYHSQDRSYVYIVSRTPIKKEKKHKNLKRSYSYKLEMDVIMDGRNIDRYDMERGVAKLYNHLAGSGGDEAFILQQAITDLKV